jgi:hypothetical protein
MLVGDCVTYASGIRDNETPDTSLICAAWYIDSSFYTCSLSYLVVCMHDTISMCIIFGVGYWNMEAQMSINSRI